MLNLGDQNNTQYFTPGQVRFFQKYKSKKWLIFSLFFFAVVLAYIFAGWQGVLTIVFGCAALYFGIKSYLEQKIMMQGFAFENNLKFHDSISLDTLSGRLFDIGNSKTAYNVLTGEYNNRPVKIFNYTYTIGSGKNRTTYGFTVCEFEIQKTKFPFIFLKSNSMYMYQEVISLVKNKDVEVKIEETKNFKLFCIEGYEIEALEIFTPEVLGFLDQQDFKVNIEFSENKINFYINRVIGKKEDLSSLYELSKKILDLLGERIERMHDDFEAIREAYSKR